MRSTSRLRLLLLPLPLWAVQTGAVAEEVGQRHEDGIRGSGQPPAMTIGTRQTPPFSYQDADGQWAGIAIELWDEVAARSGFGFRYVEPGLTEMLDAVVAGRVDGAVAALTMTSDREQILGFSHPFHTAGLAIAVPHRNAYPSALHTPTTAPGAASPRP